MNPQRHCPGCGAEEPEEVRDDGDDPGWWSRLRCRACRYEWAAGA
ncbi:MULTISPECIES: hypothetical protein [unclassified Modestobacter]